LELVRKIIQFAAAILQNSYFTGFLTGRIYQGNLKSICVPGLNCYSCPGALGACPIGSLQAIAANMKLNISLYIYGFITLVGVISGRFVCGFLCPFGLFQELLYKIPLKKFRERKFFKILNKLKYIILIVFVIGIPTVITLSGGISFPAFCQYICPAGTLQAGIPLVLLDNRLHSLVGWLYVWKISILVLVILLSVKLFRPFCRFLCPLGALYSLFNRISVIHIHTDKSNCSNCNRCKTKCLIRADNPDSPECIRCGDCIKACPSKTMKWAYVRVNTKYEDVLSS
jgi:polyferredoxin